VVGGIFTGDTKEADIKVHKVGVVVGSFIWGIPLARYGVADPSKIDFFTFGI
jgi:hypothetical protein